MTSAESALSQLIGQIYLVTVVAVIVGNLPRGATRRPRDERAR